MINLSISDPIDGFDKIGELRNAVGTECPNTGGVLISVSDDGDRCNVSRVVIGGKVKVVNEPSWLTWNKMFF
jgi:hypothetical protein